CLQCAFRLSKCHNCGCGPYGVEQTYFIGRSLGDLRCHGVWRFTSGQYVSGELSQLLSWKSPLLLATYGVPAHTGGCLVWACDDSKSAVSPVGRSTPRPEDSRRFRS